MEQSGLGLGRIWHHQHNGENRRPTLITRHSLVPGICPSSVADMVSATLQSSVILFLTQYIFSSQTVLVFPAKSSHGCPIPCPPDQAKRPQVWWAGRPLPLPNQGYVLPSSTLEDSSPGSLPTGSTGKKLSPKSLMGNFQPKPSRPLNGKGLSLYPHPPKARIMRSAPSKLNDGLLLQTSPGIAGKPLVKRKLYY